jgi:hypothetical protein
MTRGDLQRIGDAASVSIAAGPDYLWSGNRLDPRLWEALRAEMQRRFRRSTGEELAVLTVEITPAPPAPALPAPAHVAADAQGETAAPVQHLVRREVHEALMDSQYIAGAPQADYGRRIHSAPTSDTDGNVDG